MKHPGEIVIRHLQSTFTPTEYLSLIQQPQYQRAGQFTPHTTGKEYWARLPLYLVARCPLCNAAYVERLDTHSLLGWHPHPDRWDFIYTSKRRKSDDAEKQKRLNQVVEMSPPDKSSILENISQRIDCPHFVAVQHFINLHGILPKEMRYFSNQSEVPFVMPVFLPDDVESYAVMHSLPICRIEKKRFKPCYSLYLITYYSSAPHAMWERRRSEFTGEDALHFPKLYTWRTVELNKISEAWDLSLWTKKGKLLWLDLGQDDLPLKGKPPEEFPYANIEGIQKSYTFRQGKLKIDPY